MAPTLAGGTQDTDFKKGFTEGSLYVVFYFLLVFLIQEDEFFKQYFLNNSSSWFQKDQQKKRRRNGGGQGDPDPLIASPYRATAGGTMVLQLAV